MNRQLLSILAGIAVAPLIVQHVSSQPSPGFFATARKSLVLIQDTRGERKGSGFIVAKDGNIYYALTAGHVVQNGQFQIQTDATVQEGERLAVESVLTLPGVDLALVQFS
ncbi:MAG: trypsin-like peptidase domain-containing protein [Coleofasciculaceae cyanobacterium SM2_1_6]|nr:trypsin-like peptidase domain-containing protein [Coleofasciculaceae cyanobacterium SM2_1_6]